MYFDDPFLSHSKTSINRSLPFKDDDTTNDFLIEFESFSDFEGDNQSKDDHSMNSTTNYDIALNTRQPLNHLMFISMLEHICSLYVDDEETSELLFKMICEKLNNSMMIPNLSYLDEFKAVRTKYQTALKRLMEGSVAAIKQGPIDSLKPERYSKFQSVAASAFSSNSWYKDMFTSQEHLATGGFGEVVKAKNKLDHKYYAIKKIPLVDTDIKKILQTLREVQIFSDLDHANIVRYHSSWLEHGSLGIPEKVKEEGSFVSNSHEGESHSKQVLKMGQSGKFGFNLSLLHDQLLAKQTSVEESDGKQLMIIAKSNHCKVKLLKMTLYIQMELCNNTLRSWLYERNSKLKNTIEVDTCMNNNIFYQMMSAVEYIHNHGLMHRDVKPENVFLRHRASDLIVKVGDFGLARYHPTHMNPVTPTNDAPTSFLFNFNAREQTAGVGTTTYAAPEQLKNSSYTNKVDIWSLGIILFELYQPFSTEMERRISIQQLLKERTISNDIQELWKTESDLIISMTNLDVIDRPSAQEVLKIISNDEKQVMVQLQRQLRCQQKQIETLKKELKEQLCINCKEPT